MADQPGRLLAEHEAQSRVQEDMALRLLLADLLEEWVCTVHNRELCGSTRGLLFRIFKSWVPEPPSRSLLLLLVWRLAAQGLHTLVAEGIDARVGGLT